MISFIDALVIQSNEESDILVTAGGKGDKWDCWIYLLRGGEIHRPIWNTNGGLFASKNDAVSFGNRFVKALRETDGERDNMAKAIGPLCDEVVKLIEKVKAKQ